MNIGKTYAQKVISDGLQDGEVLVAINAEREVLPLHDDEAGVLLALHLVLCFTGAVDVTLKRRFF